VRLRHELHRHGTHQHLTGHGLRHSLISVLYANDTSDGLVRKVAGHHNARMSDRYHQLNAPGRAAIIAVTNDRVEWPNSISQEVLRPVIMKIT
jgi:integrase